jgi:hypothetical protein
MLEKVEIGDLIKFDDKSGIITYVSDNIIKDNNGNEYDTRYDNPMFIKFNKNDTSHDLILKGLRATLDRFTFRIQGTTIIKEGFSGSPFFFGFTGKADMHHLEIKTNNHPEVHPTVIYYQAGNYANLMLKDGKMEFGEIYDRQGEYPNGTYMMGLVSYRDQKPRFAKWTYVGPLYLLYILIVYGSTYYMFHGMTKEQIIDSLEIRDRKLGIDNPHYYQAFARVCYYNENIPEEYKLEGLKEKIIGQFDWIQELWKNYPTSD